MMPSTDFVIFRDDSTIIDPDVKTLINQDKPKIGIYDDMKSMENGKRKRWEKFASSSESGKYQDWG